MAVAEDEDEATRIRFAPSFETPTADCVVVTGCGLGIVDWVVGLGFIPACDKSFRSWSQQLATRVSSIV
jgi:hypothetical protein